MKKIMDFFISMPDTFTFLIGAIMFLVTATIANVPMDAQKGGIFGVAFGMLGGLLYTDIKTRLVNRARPPKKDKN